MSKKYDNVVYIGRFSPFHDGHLETLKKACEHGNHVIVVVGSANSAPTPKNPWTAEQRIDMIKSVVYKNHPARNQGIDYNKISYVVVEDRRYNDNKWLEYIQSSVNKVIKGQSIALIGHEKDASSYYLKSNFPNWDFIETGPYVKEHNEHGKVVSATKIRELMFEDHLGYTQSNLPTPVYQHLEKFVMSEQFQLLQGEYNHIKEEEKIVESLPYGLNFITADSIVVQSGHVLLVKRGEYPGKGLWALPGVHVDQNERSLDASLRALIDETHLKVPLKVLKGSIKETEIFDHPERSLRARLTQKNARTMTIAFFYELDSTQPLPKNVRGGEGIEQAWWFSFSEVKKMRSKLFEDHADIIDYFIG